jgi:hypothetical protein
MGSGGEDAFSGGGKKHIIIDHCTFSWSNDECFSVYNGDSTTFQWNIISEPLNYSYHFETGIRIGNIMVMEVSGVANIYQLIIIYLRTAITVTQDLMATGRASRNLLIIPIMLFITGAAIIFMQGEGGFYNITNNYFKYGPSTNKNVRYRIVNPG